jgi:hypothetical protein
MTWFAGFGLCIERIEARMIDEWLTTMNLQELEKFVNGAYPRVLRQAQPVLPVRRSHELSFFRTHDTDCPGYSRVRPLSSDRFPISVKLGVQFFTQRLP